MPGVRVTVVDNASPDDSVGDDRRPRRRRRARAAQRRLRLRLQPRRRRAAARRSCSSSTPTPGSTRASLDALVAALRDDPGAALVGPRHPRRRRLARVQPAPLPAPALDLRQGAVPAPRCSRWRAWTDELIRDPAAYERAGHRRVGVGRLHARAPRRLRGARRLRRGAVPLLRGHRPLPAPVAGRPQRPLRARRASCATSAAPPRAPARRRRSPPAAASTTRASTAAASHARLEALGVALDEATHAAAALDAAGQSPRAPRRAAGRGRHPLMRVLYSFPTRLGTAGIGTTAWQPIAGLAEHGVEVTVGRRHLRAAAAGRRAADRDAAARRASRSRSGCSASTAPCACTTAARPRALRRLRDAVDVVHTWPLGAERTLARRRRARHPRPARAPERAHRLRLPRGRAGPPRARPRARPVSGPHARRPDRLAREEREYAARQRPAVPVRLRRRARSATRACPRSGCCATATATTPRASAPTGASTTARARSRPASSAAASRARACTRALRAWLDSGAAEHGRFVIAGAIDPDYRAVLEPLLAHPSVHRARLRRRSRGADALVRRARPALGRGGQRAGDLRGARLRLRARRLGPHGRRLHATASTRSSTAPATRRR